MLVKRKQTFRTIELKYTTNTMDNEILRSAIIVCTESEIVFTQIESKIQLIYKIISIPSCVFGIPSILLCYCYGDLHDCIGVFGSLRKGCQICQAL